MSTHLLEMSLSNVLVYWREDRPFCGKSHTILWRKYRIVSTCALSLNHVKRDMIIDLLDDTIREDIVREDSNSDRITFVETTNT